ncbi:hypothetical protein KUTeg_000193 [Tegillarca granosa]|uniref:KaiA C-terminal domain-containing protein n=1 Tax=Tegillarca granosa TaxID=220873 RepID=A0ABQ9FY05_TEGGR|nr:hypothetical protein KUTeg_000193 [Tegillarca granosa]
MIVDVIPYLCQMYKHTYSASTYIIYSFIGENMRITSLLSAGINGINAFIPFEPDNIFPLDHFGHIAFGIPFHLNYDQKNCEHQQFNLNIIQNFTKK